MGPNLDDLLDGLEGWDLSVVKILTSTLAYEADTDLLASKLADDIKFICQAESVKSPRSEYSGQTVDWALNYVWPHLFDIARMTPSGHPRQDCLAKAVEVLRQTKGTAPGMGIGEWSELPGLSLAMTENWEDGRWYPDNDQRGSSKEDPSKELSEEFEAWKNLNSFAARITTNDYAPSLYFPIWEIRHGLEEPPVEGPIQGVRIWVACEWIQRCTEIIFNFVQVPPGDDDNAMQTGSLCGEEIPVRGLERWVFWKKRLQELSRDAENLKLDQTIVERMSETIKAMDAVSSKREVVGS